MDYEKLVQALEKSWCLETAYSGDRKNWTSERKTTGQCTVTAMIVYDYFGGEIIRGYSPKYKIYHYWNVVNGKKIDLTYSQFIPEKKDIKFTKIVVKKKADLMHIRSVNVRYELLKNRVEKCLSENGLKDK